MLNEAMNYASRGWRVIPVYGLRAGVCECSKGKDCAAPGKHPRIKDWVDNATTDKKQIVEWLRRWPSTNIGCAWGNGLVDIECDVDKGGRETLAALERKLGKLPKTYVWRSGGGGLHRLFSAEVRGGIEALGEGVDVLSDGRQAVMPPSKHVKGGYKLVKDRKVAKLPAAWVAHLEASVKTERTVEVDVLDRDPTATVSEAEKLLAVVPSDSYDGWLKVGMALHHQWSGTENEDAARTMWDRWSSRSGKYVPGDCDFRWGSFSGSGCTFATVRWMSKEHGGASRIKPQTLAEAIDVAKATKKAVIKAIRMARTWAEVRDAVRPCRSVLIGPESQEDVCIEIRKAAKSVGHTLTTRDAQQMVAFDRTMWFLERGKELGWINTLFLQQGKNASIIEKLESGGVVEHGRDSFNSSYGWKMTAEGDSEGGKVVAVAEPWDIAVNLMREDGTPVLPRVGGWGYKPGAGVVFRGVDGSLLVNTFQGWDAGDDEMYWSVQEDADVKLWQDHLRWLVGNKECRLLEQFLACSVQRPHERVRWCYVVLGPEGAGKTMLASELMSNVIGKQNIGVVGPSSLASPQYNDWMNNGSFGCIDELHVEQDTGREFAVVNSIKPALTDPVLTINGKFRKSVKVDNVTTWMATSNFAIPFRLTAGSRRWYFVHTASRTIEDIEKSLGSRGERKDYFMKLARAARRSSRALRGWLMGVDLGDFDQSHAPPCDWIQNILAASEDPMSALLKRAFQCGDPLTGEVIGMKMLMAKLFELDDSAMKLTERVVAGKLIQMGYRVVMRDRSPFKGEDNTRTTWYSRKDMTNEELRVYLRTNTRSFGHKRQKAL